MRATIQHKKAQWELNGFKRPRQVAISYSKSAVLSLISRGQIGRGAMPLSVEPIIVPRVVHIPTCAYSEASQLEQLPYNGVHLLLAILLEGRGMANRLLSEVGVNLAALRGEVQKTVQK